MSRPPLLFRPSAEPPASAESSRAPAAAPRSATSPSAGHEFLSESAPARDEAPAGAEGEPIGIESFASEQSLAAATPSPSDPIDRLEASFAPALEPPAEIRFKTQRPASGGPRVLTMAVAASLVAAILVLTYVMLTRGGGRGASDGTDEAAGTAGTAATGQAQFDSRPAGAEVIIDGQARGTTPLKLTLPVGAHTLEMRNGAASRALPLTIESGVLVSQYVELAAAPAGNTGRLEITSDPPGAQVALDGVARGVTPLTLDAVEAREHAVSLSRGSSRVLRTVRVTAGSSASVFASLGGAAATPGAVGGYLALSVPFEVQVLEDGRLLGTSSSERLMLPTGRHQLELVNSELQFRAALPVTVEAGRTTSPDVVIPDGTLSVNALPWADVLIDGRAVGQTPLANLTLPIGTHDIVWRHPQFGERRQRVTVTAQAPTRVGVNLAQ